VPQLPPARRRVGAAAHRRVGATTAALATVALAASLTAGSPAQATDTRTATLGAPRVVTLPASTMGTGPRTGAVAPVLAPSLTTFAHTFASGGKTYSYRMVGTDPLKAAATTTVATTLTSVSFVINGETVSPTWASYSAVLNSALFHPATLPGGKGQYGDLFMRTQFWAWLQTYNPRGVKNWHVNLAAPVTKPRITLTVPTGKGEVVTVRGVRVAVVDVTWFDAAVRASVTAPAANVFTQLLAGNVVLCDPYSAASLATCGIGGYHSAVSTATGAHTYSFQSYLAKGVFDASTGFVDLGPMSHELAEWLADPYVNNAVPGWKSPLAPQYGCLGALESGDPVVTSQIVVNGLHYQDEAYVWWFARRPSLSWLGRYTWFNALTKLSVACTPPPL